MVAVVVLASMFEGKEISSVGQALVWLDLGLIKEGVGPVLISA